MFFLSLSEMNGAGAGEILNEYVPSEPTNSTPLSPTLLLSTPMQGVTGGNDYGTSSAADANVWSIFSSATPALNLWYYNQNTELNDEGYDSKGGLPTFADGDEGANSEGYNEEPLNDVPRVPMTAPPVTEAPAVEAMQLTMEMVMGLNVNRLKEELRKRGRSFAGKKGELQERLKEVVINNVPVALGNEPRCHKSMAGLDVTARWELLTPAAEPVPKPLSENQGHHPPTKMDGLRNPKYAMVERFQRGVFMGTNEKMRYVKPCCASPLTRDHRKERRRKKSPSRQLREAMPIEPRVLGGPNTDFLARYGLDKNSHPMDWFTAFMPTPDTNREDTAAANVKGDQTMKFAVSNWHTPMPRPCYAMLGRWGVSLPKSSGHSATRISYQCLECTSLMASHLLHS